MNRHSNGETPGSFDAGGAAGGKAGGGERRFGQRFGYKPVVLSDAESQDFDDLMSVFEVPQEHILDFGDGPSGVYSS